MSQCKWVLHRLEQAPLTQAQALHERGIARLGARILELRDKGHNINSRMITVRNRFGDDVRVAQYSLMRS